MGGLAVAFANPAGIRVRPSGSKKAIFFPSSEPALNYSDVRRWRWWSANFAQIGQTHDRPKPCHDRRDPWRPCCRPWSNRSSCPAIPARCRRNWMVANRRPVPDVARARSPWPRFGRITVRATFALSSSFWRHPFFCVTLRTCTWGTALGWSITPLGETSDDCGLAGPCLAREPIRSVIERRAIQVLQKPSLTHSIAIRSLSRMFEEILTKITATLDLRADGP